MDTVKEGKASYHEYRLLAEDGETLVHFIEDLKYKVSDGVDDLIEWTDLPHDNPGTIIVPGPINRIGDSGRSMRYLTLFAIHDEGNHLPEEVKYKILDQVGITSTTTPTGVE